MTPEQIFVQNLPASEKTVLENAEVIVNKLTPNFFHWHLPL